MKSKEGGDFLQELYIKKFYSDNKPTNTFEKVISFQKKLEEFKVNRNSQHKNTFIDSNILLKEEINHFRPSTNHSSYHIKRQHSTSYQKKRVQGPATLELRLILDRKHTADNSITKKIETSLYQAHHNRKRMKLFSYRENSPQPSETQQKISRVDMMNFLTDRKISTSDNKVRSVHNNRKLNLNIDDEQQRSKSISKRVFIGGRNLEKAAEEYYKHYKQMNKDNAKKDMKITMSEIDKKTINIDKKRIQRKVYKKHKLIIPHKGPNIKTQPKSTKYQDQILNLQLDPWNVDVDYY